MNNEIKKRLDAIDNKDAIRLFFQLLHDMIVELKFDADNEKLAINVRNDYRKRLSVNLNSHLVFSIQDGDIFGLKVNKDDLATIEGAISLIRKEEFATKTLPAIFVEMSYADFLANLEMVKALWLKSCAIYEPMIAKSRYRKHHIPELYELAMDNSLLNRYLDGMEQPSNSFKQIIDELEVYLKAEDNVLADFTINKKVFTNAYVWISDHNDEIGSLNAHYEIIVKKDNKAYVAIHFESALQQEKDVYQQYITGLPTKIKWVKWHHSRSLEHTDPIALQEPDIVKKIANELLYLEENMGEKIREILKRSLMPNNETSNKRQPLNQILYGPPGTGKTYNTINKALEIIGEKIEDKTRQEIKDLFDLKMKEGQIVFTTFHQSMSYEDFIEGIKPMKPSENRNNVQYEVAPGIFKRLCRKAETLPNPSFTSAYSKLLTELEKVGEISLPHKKESFTILIADNGVDLDVKSNSYIKNRKRFGS